jgi:hypothetical protein
MLYAVRRRALIGYEGFRGRHSARCPRSRARLLLDCSDSAQEYGHPEQEKMRAEVRGHGRVVMKSIDSAAILITY